MSTAPGRYWIVRHPTSGGDIVAKFDTAGGSIIPDEVANYTGFVIQEVSDRSSLDSHTIDQSGLTQDELDLLSEVYPVER